MIMIRMFTGAAVLVMVAATAEAADLVQTAKGTDEFDTFTKLVEQAGLGRALSGEGPFTVFAPTDAAFEGLPGGLVEGLMKPENEQQLTTLLEHHVVDGSKLTVQQLMGRETPATTLSGDQLSIDGTTKVMVLVPTGLRITHVGDQVIVDRNIVGGQVPAVTVTEGSEGKQAKAAATTAIDQQAGVLRAATVVEAGIDADNGIIHGIDQVLVPQKLEQALNGMAAEPAQG